MNFCVISRILKIVDIVLLSYRIPIWFSFYSLWFSAEISYIFTHFDHIFLYTFEYNYTVLKFLSPNNSIWNILRSLSIDSFVAYKFHFIFLHLAVLDCILNIKNAIL